MITNDQEYVAAQEELRYLEVWLETLQRDHLASERGLTKAGVRKLIARLHEELALFEGHQEVTQAKSTLVSTTDTAR